MSATKETVTHVPFKNTSASLKATHEHRSPSINQVLSQTILDKLPDFAKYLEEEQVRTYDPILVTVFSNLRSVLPQRDDDEWIQEELLSLSDKISHFCPKPIKAFIKNSNTNSPYTFVILEGTFSEWEKGISSNQVVATLDKYFNKPVIINLGGYLSASVLEESCSNIPWSINVMARDLYMRLYNYLEKNQAKSEYTGIIGVSGGGGLAINIMGMDAAYAKQRIGNGDLLELPVFERRLFGLGGISISPTLHGRIIFNKLDRNVKGVRHLGFFNTVRWDWEDAYYIWFFIESMFSHKWFELDWSDISVLYEEHNLEFKARFYNEFTRYLEMMLEALSPNIDMGQIDKELSYHNIFVQASLKRNWPTHFQQSEESLKTIFDRGTKFTPYLENIDKPFFIYLSQDDPLYTNKEGGQPRAITKILEQANENPNITVFNPPYGGHMGIFFRPYV